MVKLVTISVCKHIYMHCVWKHVQLPRYIAKIQAVIDGRCQGTMSMKIMLLSPRLLPNRFRSCFWREFNNTTRSIKLVKQTHKRGIKNFVLSPHWVWQVFRWQLHQMANGESTCWWWWWQDLGCNALCCKSCWSSCTAARKSHKKWEKSGRICIQATRHQKSLSSPDSPQFFIHKVHFQSHHLTARSHSLMPNTWGGNRLGGVLYFLRRRSGKCRGEASLFSAPPLICLPTGNKTSQCIFQKNAGNYSYLTGNYLNWMKKEHSTFPFICC